MVVPKTFLVKGTSTFIDRQICLRNPPDLIVLDNCSLKRFIYVDILLAKGFLNLVIILLLEVIH